MGGAVWTRRGRVWWMGDCVDEVGVEDGRGCVDKERWVWWVGGLCG